MFETKGDRKIILRFAEKTKIALKRYVFSNILLYLTGIPLTIFIATEHVDVFFVLLIIFCLILNIVCFILGIMAAISCRNLSMSGEYTTERDLEIMLNKSRTLRLLLIVDAILIIFGPLKIITTLIIIILYFDFIKSDCFTMGKVKN